jgi:predicted CopG family antitoxin
MSCFKKIKFTLENMKDTCPNMVDIINNKPICITGKICSHLKEIEISHSFSCEVTGLFHMTRDGHMRKLLFGNASDEEVWKAIKGDKEE